LSWHIFTIQVWKSGQCSRWPKISARFPQEGASRGQLSHKESYFVLFYNFQKLFYVVLMGYGIDNELFISHNCSAALSSVLSVPKHLQFNFKSLAAFLKLSKRDTLLPMQVKSILKLLHFDVL
jgi:hypothetical protein